MHNADYSSAPYYHQHHFQQSPNPNPNPTDPLHPAPPPPYASAPPFSANTYTPPPPPPSTDYSPYHHNYPSLPQTPDPLPAATAYSQPQSHYSFPQFEAHASYQPPPHSQPPSYYDHPTPNYASNPNHNPVSPNSGYPSIHPPPAQYSQPNSNLYEPQYDNHDVNLSRSRSDLGAEMYGKRAESGYGSDSPYGNTEGVYAYRGSNEPYGARGTAPNSSTWSGFDDFGRPIGYTSPSSSEKERPKSSSLKVVRAVPKADVHQDPKSSVQKFRVKLLAESGGQSTMDVLCQIGLDGIRMLDPSTNRTLRIYLLDTITRCEAIESAIFAFWSKSSVDFEARRIRLKSNSYTTTTILDTVTAAIAQYKEMSGRTRPTEYPKIAEQPAEKKKGFADFINKIKPVNEEKDHWVPDEATSKCTSCGTDFGAFVRRHHCRNCGDIFCDKCTQGRTALNSDENAPVVRVCDRCLAEVSRRLNSAKEGASRSTIVQNHEDLAKKLQEEMERSCKVSSGSRSGGSGRRMKEVACPTCTVHLQVQVPSSGSETIECGVCQHPFLVTGN
ncbi:protein FREE1-like [Salvia splendens]|uniref:protein FREE1-like n=1 Tax=Salvia splendens TaxID=180675 RepID=UPI001C265E96|nr:protein FREE1-like [Salvia splendens]